MTPLHERVRPATLDEVVGQDKAVAVIRRLQSFGIGGRAIWISGKSGTGKTTLARIIAGMVADPFWVEEMDAQDVRLETVREWERALCFYGGGKGGRAVIVNEAHGLSGSVVRRLLTLLEPLPSHAVMIFTTTVDGQAELLDGSGDVKALLSRCCCVQLSQRDLAEPFARFAKAAAEAAGVDGRPHERYVALAKKHGNNLRAMLSDIESGAMIGDAE